MSNRTLIYVVIVWCLFKVIEYYFIPYFIVTFLWLGLSLALLIVIIVLLIKVARERKSLTKLRIAKVLTFLTLFYLTYNHFVVSGLIEKVDWKIFYSKRMKIVEQVKRKELKPNVSWNNVVCELPFEFPVVSNGGNDIMIFRNKDNGTVTVSFWIYRNFFNAPSTGFVYTNDIEQIKELESQINHDPKNNWKINNNWYRTSGE